MIATLEKHLKRSKLKEKKIRLFFKQLKNFFGEKKKDLRVLNRAKAHGTVMLLLKPTVILLLSFHELLHTDCLRSLFSLLG